MNPKVVLGVCGNKGAGKDTFYNFIKEKYPSATKRALADKLKKVCSDIFNIDLNYFNDENLKEEDLESFIYLTGEKIIEILNSFNVRYNFDAHVRPHIAEVIKTPRKLAQYVGTEVLRGFEKDLHVRLLCDSFANEEFIVITDVRYLNEFEYLKSKFGDKFFGIYIDNYSAAFRADKDPHYSEKEVKLVGKSCHRIENNGSIREFQISSLQAVKSILSLHNIILGG